MELTYSNGEYRDGVLVRVPGESAHIISSRNDGLLFQPILVLTPLCKCLRIVGLLVNIFKCLVEATGKVPERISRPALVHLLFAYAGI